MTEVYSILTIFVSLMFGIIIGRIIISRLQSIRHKNRLRKIIEEDHKRALIIEPFFKYILPIHQEFEENDIKDEDRVLDVLINQFKKVYELGVIHCLGIKINWIKG